MRGCRPVDGINIRGVIFLRRGYYQCIGGGGRDTGAASVSEFWHGIATRLACKEIRREGCWYCAVKFVVLLRWLSSCTGGGRGRLSSSGRVRARSVASSTSGRCNMALRMMLPALRPRRTSQLASLLKCWEDHGGAA